MENTTAFEPIFLYREQELIENQKRLHTQWLAQIQNGIDTASELFDEPLTDDELTQIMLGGWKATEQIMRSKSQFPNAKIETLLDLKGKDSHQAKLALTNVATRSQAIKASIVDGKAVIGENVISELEEAYTHYTKSPDQNRLIYQAKELGDNIQDLLDKNVIHGTDISSICHSLKIIKYVNNDGLKIVPDLVAISKQ
ncbi:MAG: hypothetical protein KDK44_00930 [Chlamydiia bacterium]|nr:hypothetical protein [Chlamydiia bacterium]